MPARILEIGNYPPPVCGWSIQTKLLVEELRRRGAICEMLNINENRTKQSSEYVGVHNGFDYLYKLIRFACRGFRFQVHVNGQSEKGYILALMAALVGRVAARPIALSWRGGLQQKYFPRSGNSWARWLFQLLFQFSGQISCNSAAIKHAIEDYGIPPNRVVAIPGFSAQHLGFTRVPLSPETEDFLSQRQPVFFCYLAFRPEYKLPVLRQAMLAFRQQYPRAGFIWLGFPSKEMPAAESFLNAWLAEERSAVLLLGNISHDEFLTLMTRSFAYIRTTVCDGVSASVLEALALGVPVVASQNNHRPENVTTFQYGDPVDLCAKLVYVTERYSEIKRRTCCPAADDNIARTVDWLLAAAERIPSKAQTGLAHAG